MPVVIRQIFDVQTGDISQYHAHMLDFIDNACPKRDNISVVGPHRGTEDWNWAYVELRVGGTKMVVLAICMDTLYLYAWKKGGFESENPWLCFARESPVGLEGVNEELPFNGNYRTLGDPHNVVVNRPSLVNSVFTIHDSPSSEASKPALLILILVFCASIRIKSIYQFLLDALSDDHRHQLLRMDSQREKNWKKASDHYLRGRAIFIEGYEIVSHDTISQELSVLLWSVGESYDFPSSRGWIPLEPLKKEDDKYKNGSKEDSRRHNKGKRNSQYLTSRQRARMETTGRRRQPNILNETSNASKERSQVSFSPSKLERYLGTVREENTFNIPLEFVPGGSVSSLLSNFGSFPESGVSILFDNKGCIHLADFGASKQVAKPATMIAAISMKGTPYWMVPEVISLTGHSSADIWSSTVIEMATSKPPWYQEVAALFHVGATKSHPPIPEDLALEANDFLLKCLQEEPGLHPTSSDLLQHPFLMEESEDVKQLNRSGSKESCNNVLSTNKTQTSNFCTIMNHDKIFLASPLWETSNYDDDDMCQLDDGNDFLLIGLIFNPVSEPWEEWPCKFDISPKQRRVSSQHLGKLAADHYDINRRASKIDCSDANWFSFPTDAACEDDDEVTGSKIRAFLDEKALDLKKLQTPLYEEFQNTLNASNAKVISSVCKEEISNNSNNKTANAPKLPPMTPSKISSAASPTMLLPSGFSRNFIPGSSFSQPISRYSMCGSCVLQEITSPPKMYEQVPPEHHSDITEPMTTSTNVSDLRENGKKNPPRSLKD